MTITRQRFGKHFPKVKLSTLAGLHLLGIKSLGTYLSQGSVALRLTHVSWQRK
jgi:hypothetical protein